MYLLVLYQDCGQKVGTYWHQLLCKSTQCTANGLINAALLADFVSKQSARLNTDNHITQR